MISIRIIKYDPDSGMTFIGSLHTITVHHKMLIHKINYKTWFPIGK